MIKKSLVLILCVIILLSFTSCGDTTDGTPSNENSSIEETTNDIKEKSSIEAVTNDIEENDVPAESIFNTKDIKRITFYAYYGQGKGSQVPAGKMSEITAWLGTFSLDNEVDDILPPGTNTYHVEIEYLDGTIVKEGLDVIEVDGISYYVKHATYPDSFMDIISKTSISIFPSFS